MVGAMGRFYQAFNLLLFFVTDQLFSTLRELQETRGDGSISVCVCVRERKREREGERGRERERERERERLLRVFRVVHKH